MPTVTISGDRAGTYVIEDERPDGRLVLRPERAFLAPGETVVSDDKFSGLFGHLPADGEG